VVTDERKRGCNYYAQPGRRPLPLKRTTQIFTLTEIPRLVGGTALDLAAAVSTTPWTNALGPAAGPTTMAFKLNAVVGPAAGAAGVAVCLLLESMIGLSSSSMTTWVPDACEEGGRQ
jgi:hypothetical protein